MDVSGSFDRMEVILEQVVTCKLFPYRFSRRNLALTAFLKSTKLLTSFQSFALLLVQLYHALLSQLVNFISELLQPLTSHRTSTHWRTLSNRQIESRQYLKLYSPKVMNSSLLMSNLSKVGSFPADMENHCRSNLQQEACQNEAQEIYAYSQTHLRHMYENRLFLQQQAVWTSRWC